MMVGRGKQPMQGSYVRLFFQRTLRELVPHPHRVQAALNYSLLAAAVERMVRAPSRRTGIVGRIEPWIEDLFVEGLTRIPTRLLHSELLLAARSQGKGVLVCHTHTPLYWMPPTALVQAGLPPSLIVTAEHSAPRGTYVPPGTTLAIPAAWSGPNSLLGVRSELRKGGLIYTLLDEDIGLPLKGNVLRVAARLSAVVLFCTIRPRPNRFEVALVEPPFPLQRGEDDVLANLADMERRRQQWLDPGDRGTIE